MTSLFGKRALRGTGRTADYFPQAPDLDFLDRPAFIPSGGGYNAKLDPQNLVSAGFSPRNAMVLQDIRRQMHEDAQMEREQMDSQRAMDSLSRLDPSSKGFSKELLNIFRGSPGAIHNPDVRQTADFLSRFANQKPEWTVENIEDPDIYEQAVREKWDTLTPSEARRRANAAITQRGIRGELAALGMSQQDLDKNPTWSQEAFLREKGRLLRESKAAPREALGSSELGKFNEALTSYNDALAGVDAAATEDAKRAAFKTATGKDPVTEKDWQDAYNLVKQSTVGAPKQALQQMVDLYQGRAIPPVVMQALGIPTTPSVNDVKPATTAPVTWPTDAPTTFGPGQAPVAAPATTAVAPVTTPLATVSPADLKRVDAAPVSFESLSEQVANLGATQRKAREDEFLARQKTKEKETAADSQLWEGAKTKLLQGISPELVQTLSASPTEAQMVEIFQRAGIDPNTPAFTFPAVNGIPGREVSWNEALIELAKDPRISKIQSGSAAAPSRKSFAHLF